MKKLIFLLIVTIALNACKEETPITFSEINFTSEEAAIVEINIPKFEGNAEVSDKMNALIQSFTAFNISLEEETMEAIKIEEAINQFDKEYQSFTEKIFDASQPWEAFVDGEVTYQSSEIICVAINTYTNTGSANGTSVISFLNFNPYNGELYKNEDLIKDMESFKILAKSHYDKISKARPNSDDISFQFPDTIGFSDDGVIILLNSDGLIVDSPEFTIPYEDLNDLLKVR